MTADPRTEARKRALIAGAVHRGEVPAVGTLVKLRGKSSAPTTVTYKVTEVRARGTGWEVFLEYTTRRGWTRKVWARADQVVPAPGFTDVW